MPQEKIKEKKVKLNNIDPEKFIKFVINVQRKHKQRLRYRKKRDRRKKELKINQRRKTSSNRCKLKFNIFKIFLKTKGSTKAEKKNEKKISKDSPKKIYRFLRERSK